MLRAGCLPLEIERGRFCKPCIPLNERLCSLCNLHLVEDEEHFITKCSLYVDLRNELFTHCKSLDAEFENKNDTEKFNLIMSTGDNYIINTVFKMFNR